MATKDLEKRASTISLSELIGFGLEDNNGIYTGKVTGFSEQSKVVETDRNYKIPFCSLDYYKIVEPVRGENV